ncbi:MAG TPA: Wzz/FepE/Etk N-terminal domain-containing protein [Blastocatellia bacterium]|nr:Wzz/FepE/Etk N-terminal domain-containing protein [Blastocatellia bacterium]
MGSFRPRSFIECLHILWRRKSLIAFIGLVVLLAATAVIMGIQKVYESRALIVVSGAIYDKQANGAQVAAVTEQITSRSNLEALLQRYNLQGPVTNLDSAIQQLQKEIKLETKFRLDSAGFPESFAVSYRHPDPVIARNVVVDLVAAFDQANKTLAKQAAEEAERIHAEIAELEAKLGHATTQKLASAARSSAASRTAGAIERQRAEQSAIASTVETLHDRQFALEAQVAEQKRMINQQQEIVRTSPPPVDDMRATGSYGALLKRKADLEAQIEDYSSKFTEKYPKLVQAREQLAEVKQRIAGATTTGEQARASATSPAALELRNLQRELSRLETDLEIVRREIDRKQQAASRLPSGGAAPSYIPAAVPSAAYAGTSGIASDYGSEGLRERYTALIRREDALREFQPSTTGPATPFFQMVDQPNLPQSPAGPIRSRLMLIAALLALIVGVIGAAVAESRTLSMIYDERDVNYFLGVPVVALIPETLTTKERGHDSRRMFALRLRYLAIGAAAVPLVALLLNFTKIFQILGSK